MSMTVLSCLPEQQGAEETVAARSPWLTGVQRVLAAGDGRLVGPRPGKRIDPLLAGRVLVIGDDADLAAVALRLMRTEKLASVQLAYVSRLPTPFSTAHRLPSGPAGLRVAGRGQPRPITLVRDDVGGVLLGRGSIAPITGMIYADEHRVLAGPAASVVVAPDDEKGLTVTVTGRRRWGVFGGGSRSTKARAVQISAEPMTPSRDGVDHPRPVDRWIWYRHTEPLLLVEAADGE